MHMAPRPKMSLQQMPHPPRQNRRQPRKNRNARKQKQMQRPRRDRKATARIRELAIITLMPHRQYQQRSSPPLAYVRAIAQRLQAQSQPSRHLVHTTRQAMRMLAHLLHQCQRKKRNTARRMMTTKLRPHLLPNRTQAARKRQTLTTLMRHPPCPLLSSRHSVNA
jgi:hypothetical protein